MTYKTRLLWLIIFILLSSAAICLLSLFTIKPYRISGNGNLGLLFIPPFFIFLVGALFFCYLVIQKMRMNRFIPLTALFVFLIAGFQEYNFVRNRIHALGGWTDNPDSKVYRFGWLNQYTNDMWFNGYVWLMVFSVFVIVFYVKRVYWLRNE
ncbi:hypothetical protein CGZ75_12910 [Paenibacillus herberti]|uniref:ABC transporter permease n=2 Tax=Paenibacillus herberti TaxID=1619309 RepID=A0A229NVI9_9BACL|nr:hypothetical protein CGZ75_12910 [Paenibacillus herberti]